MIRNVGSCRTDQHIPPAAEYESGSPRDGSKLAARCGWVRPREYATDGKGSVPKTIRKKSTTSVESGKANTPATVTLKHVAARLAEQHNLSKKRAEATLSDLVA